MATLKQWRCEIPRIVADCSVVLPDGGVDVWRKKTGTVNHRMKCTFRVEFWGELLYSVWITSTILYSDFVSDSKKFSLRNLGQKVTIHIHL